MPNSKYVKVHWQRLHKEESKLFQASTLQWRRLAFDPIKHRCSWCLGEVPARTDHRDTCPVLFQLSMIRAVTMPAKEDVSNESAELDLSLPADDTLRKWNLECQLCHAPCTARGLRKHLEQKHADIWKQAQPQVDKLCAAWAPGLKPTCQFCNSTYSKRNGHAITCHAITQTAFARVRASVPADSNPEPDGGEHGQPGNSGSVRTTREQRSPHGPGQKAVGSINHAARRQSTAEGQQTQQRSKRRSRKGGQDLESAGPGIDGSQIPGGVNGGHASSSITDHFAPRRSVENPQAEHGVDSFRSHRKPVHLTGDHSDVTEMEGRDCQTQLSFRQCEFEGSALLEPGGTADSGGSKLDTGAERACLDLGVDDPNRGVEVSGVVAREPLPRGGPLPRSDLDGGSHQDPCRAEVAGHVGGGVGLLLESPSHGSDAGKDGGVSARCDFPETSGSPLLRAARSIAGTGIHATLRTSAPQGRISEITRGPEAGRDASLRTLVLRNTSNHCYINSVVRTLLWTIVLDPGLDDSFGSAGLTFLKQLLKHNGKPMLIAGQLMFNFALRGWRSPSQQHDCAEFYQHIIARLGATAFEGTWEARRLDEDALGVITEVFDWIMAAAHRLSRLIFQRGVSMTPSTCYTAGILKRIHMRYRWHRICCCCASLGTHRHIMLSPRTTATLHGNTPYTCLFSGGTMIFHQARWITRSSLPYFIMDHPCVRGTTLRCYIQSGAIFGAMTTLSQGFKPRTQRPHPNIFPTVFIFCCAGGYLRRAPSGPGATFPGFSPSVDRSLTGWRVAAMEMRCLSKRDGSQCKISGAQSWYFGHAYSCSVTCTVEQLCGSPASSSTTAQRAQSQLSVFRCPVHLDLHTLSCFVPITTFPHSFANLMSQCSCLLRQSPSSLYTHRGMWRAISM